MTCMERDQDLLLLAHDALPFGERLRTQWHVAWCARCRQRLNELEIVSRVLAATINPRAVQGGSARFPRGHGSRPGLMVSPVLLTVLVVVMMIGITVLAVHTFQAGHAQFSQGYHQHHLPPGCAPNLPNDKCH